VLRDVCNWGIWGFGFGRVLNFVTRFSDTILIHCCSPNSTSPMNHSETKVKRALDMRLGKVYVVAAVPVLYA
jgi:hypothetical protein